MKSFDGHEAFETGMTHYGRSDFQKAVVCFDKAIECGLEQNVYGFRGDCLRECGSHEKAIDDYNTAVSLQPEDCNLFFSRSFAKSAAGDIDGAIEDLREAIRLSKIDSALNREYRLGAQEMGWRDGHTALYVSHLLMAQMKREYTESD